MARKPNKWINAEDRELFRQTVGTVTPVVSDRLHLHTRPKPKPIPKSRLIDLERPFRGGSDDFLVELGVTDSLSYITPGFPKNILRKMRQGFFDIEAELDLHGLTERQAKQRLLSFLRCCTLDRLRCVNIIHGKGYRSLRKNPVLKNKLNAWLRQHDDVVAFCSSMPSHGGTGAVYVLLKP